MDENSQTFLFTVGADGVAKILEGVVVLRIYSGWIKTHIKKWYLFYFNFELFYTAIAFHLLISQ